MVLERGTVTAKRYCEEVLITHVNEFIIMNACPYHASCIQDLLQSEGIDHMEWRHAYSLVLSPIENA